MFVEGLSTFYSVYIFYLRLLLLNNDRCAQPNCRMAFDRQDTHFYEIEAHTLEGDPYLRQRSMKTHPFVGKHVMMKTQTFGRHIPVLRHRLIRPTPGIELELYVI